jgi:hypothetical protein
VTPRATLLLVVLAVIALGGGWYFGVADTPGNGLGSQTAPAGRLAFPDLAPALQKAARIEVTHAGKSYTLTRRGAQWVSEAAGGYPVQADRLHAVLTGLTELRLMEPRTADPALLERLGLGDPTKPGSTATLLRVLDGDGKPIAALILGHRITSAQADLPEQIYVRRPGENQSWLAEGRLEVDDDPANWLDRQIADIAPDRLASVSATPVGTAPDQALVLKRTGGKAELTVPAAHPPLDQYKLDDVFQAYQYLSFTDVKPLAAGLPGTPVGSSRFTTTDGMVLDATVSKAGDSVWATFAASGSGAVKAAADTIEARVRGWAFQIVPFKQTSLVPTIDSLKINPPAPAPAPAPAQGTPAPAAGAP